jgi:hypothetical protein
MLGLAGYTKSKIKIMPSGHFSDFFYQKTQLAPEYPGCASFFCVIRTHPANQIV